MRYVMFSLCCLGAFTCALGTWITGPADSLTTLLILLTGLWIVAAHIVAFSR